jgi:hypothetical protein
MAFCIDRFGDGFFDRPSLNKYPSSQCSRVDSYHFRPFLERFCYSIMGKIKSVSLISVLRCFIGPSTVRWFVVSIWINSIECCSFWALSHISKKSSERTPAIANLYSSTAIRAKVIGEFVAASCVHCSPRCISVSFREFVNLCSLGAFFSSKTSTRKRLSSYERITGNICFVSAIADTAPFDRFSITSANRDFYRCNASKSLSVKINRLSSTHSAPRMLRTLMGAWQASVLMLFGSYPSHAERIMT